MSCFGVTAGGGYQIVTNTAPDGSLSISTNYNGRLLSVTRKDANGNQLGQTTYGYDAHGRGNTVTDSRNGTTTTTFDNDDRPVSVTTPAPGSGQSSQVITTYYNNMGLVTNVVFPDNGSLVSDYLLTGERKITSGARTYPSGYSYDYAGRLKTITNWTSFSTSQGAEITTWNYDGYRGFVTNKVYADGKGPSYAYTAAGRLKTRTWARGIAATESYDVGGSPTNVSYSDSTPSISTTYDRRGRQTQTTAGNSTASLLYNDSGAVLRESYSGGTLDGLSMTNVYDSLLRRTTNGLVNSNGVFLAQTRYTYDAASRLASVSDGTNAGTYTYLANSPLVSQIAFTQSGTNRMTTTKAYDFLNRLTSINSSNSVLGKFSSFSYAYNNANQRTSITNADGSYWVYLYDSLGQVVSGKKYWSDGTAVAGQQFEYGFDDIGNRLFAGSGGDQWGANLRYENYTANNLNQYAQRTAPGAVDVIGAANSNATVNVNNLPGSRKGEYFRAEVPMANGTAAAYQTMTNVAVLNNGANADIVTTNSGNVFLPKTPETFAYDADGNTTNDGRWMLTWNADNRLIAAESQTTAPTASKRKVVVEYDTAGRLIRRTEYDGSSGSYVVASDLKFVANGWQCVAELTATNNNVVRTYLWGLDSSGTLGGGGGLGGLVALNSSANGGHFHVMDGNGNVTALITAAGGSASATYEYGPFGQTIRANGLLANENPFRFSTKRADGATDFAVYEYRPYRPATGCWLSRDRMEQGGGPHLYGFCGNAPIATQDRYGLSCYAPADNNHAYLNSQLKQNCQQSLLGEFQTETKYQSPLATGFPSALSILYGASDSFCYWYAPYLSRNIEAGFLNGTINSPTLRPEARTVVHELTHGVNWLRGLDKPDRDDEGMAYAMETFLDINHWLVQLEAAMPKYSDCDALRSQVKVAWQGIWTRYGQIPSGNWGGGDFEVGYQTYPFMLVASDVQNLNYWYHVKLSCHDLAAKISWLLLTRQPNPCCLAVSCEKTSPDPIHIIPSGMNILPLFR